MRVRGVLKGEGAAETSAPKCTKVERHQPSGFGTGGELLAQTPFSKGPDCPDPPRAQMFFMNLVFEDSVAVA